MQNFILKIIGELKNTTKKSLTIHNKAKSNKRNVNENIIR